MTVLGSLSDWQTADLIDYLASTPWWASLHSADPRIGIATAHEFGGSSYHRVQVEVAASGARTLVSTTGPSWTNLSANTIAFVGLFTGAVGGSLRAAMPLSDPYPVIDGGAYALAAGQIYIAW